MPTRAVGSVLSTGPGLPLPSAGRAATGGLDGALANGRSDRRAVRGHPRAERGGAGAPERAGVGRHAFLPPRCSSPDHGHPRRCGHGGGAPRHRRDPRPASGRPGRHTRRRCCRGRQPHCHRADSGQLRHGVARRRPDAHGVQPQRGGRRDGGQHGDRRARRRRPGRPLQPRRRRPGAGGRHRLVLERVHAHRAQAGDGHPRRSRRRHVPGW